MFKVTFSVAGVETYIFLPPLVSFFLAYFGAMAGVTGAFLLLPFQMSVLGYTSPSVSATNLLYNLFTIPPIVLSYARDGRLNWPLAFCISAGSSVGIGGGYFLRVRYLEDPLRFKPFAGLVLLYLAFRLGKDLIIGEKRAMPPKKAIIKYDKFSLKHAQFSFAGQIYSFSPIEVFLVSLLVGIVGGAYGIGGGAIMAPYCLSVLKLPVYTVAGATLFGTLVSSIAGVLFYSFGKAAEGVATRPDFFLGALFGLGGMLGGFLGARSQKFIPERPIKVGLFLVVSFIALRYLSLLFILFSD